MISTSSPLNLNLGANTRRVVIIGRSVVVVVVVTAS